PGQGALGSSGTAAIVDRSGDAIRDRCAVFGIWGVDKPAEYVYLGLHNLQHRGQESSGIVSATQRKFHSHYGMGIVNEIFTERMLHELNGRGAIGHNRYSTLGSSSLENAQPLIAQTQHGPVAIAHNGQFANCNALRARLQREGCIFSSDSDTEIILHNYARSSETSVEKIVAACFAEVKPAYSIVMLTLNELIAVRDPSGVRPLVFGKVGRAFVVASETVAFDIIRAEYLGEVEPGEMLIINDGGLQRHRLFPPGQQLRCIFEHIYFARPDSFLFGSRHTTGDIRKEFGRQLWREHPVEADVVIPVPDSSTFAAMGFSEASGIPFDFGLVRSHYIGRTFIEPTQAIRDAKVRKKYNPNRSVLLNRRVVLVEDSIVRGTTLKNIIRIIRDFGAREVHVRVSSPPYRFSCYLGIDTAETKRLIAHSKSVDRIRAFLGADSLGYLSQEGMLANRLLEGGFCTYCFNGETRISRR
ncbi:MAG: amidophosphoribosyltransferase, partial [Spirochaetales bacterium]|nr:amidophosphoribosyltransferase [Spirochaetales bacterium]